MSNDTVFVWKQKRPANLVAKLASEGRAFSGDKLLLTRKGLDITLPELSRYCDGAFSHHHGIPLEEDEVVAIGRVHPEDPSPTTSESTASEESTDHSEIGNKGRDTRRDSEDGEEEEEEEEDGNEEEEEAGNVELQSSSNNARTTYS